jgi:hypothetical protein
MPTVQTIALDAIVLPEQLMRTDTIMQDLGRLDRGHCAKRLD